MRGEQFQHSGFEEYLLAVYCKEPVQELWKKLADSTVAEERTEKR